MVRRGATVRARKRMGEGGRGGGRNGPKRVASTSEILGPSQVMRSSSERTILALGYQIFMGWVRTSPD
jgi:hypothetical protein